jgi:hypothetical protein
MGEMQAKLLREKLESGVEVEELQDKEWVSGGVIQSLNPLREDGPSSIPATPAAAAAAVHASGGGRSAGRRSSAAAPEAAPQLMVHNNFLLLLTTVDTKLTPHVHLYTTLQTPHSFLSAVSLSPGLSFRFLCSTLRVFGINIYSSSFPCGYAGADPR